MNFTEPQTNGDPIQLLKDWFKAGQKVDTPNPNAFVLSTVCQAGIPSIRVLLVKEITDEGLIFYTNFTSRKGIEIDENPHVACNLYWDNVSRQIKIKGRAQKTSREKTLAYWSTRPRQSQISQLVSKQSQSVKTREQMEKEYEKIKSEFEGRDIPCPNNWGGYLVVPQEIEFWIGHTNRFHDRIRFYRDSSNNWLGQRLYP